MSGRVLNDGCDAGRKLGERLQPLAADKPVVLALPRDGVPVGFEVARALRAPLDVMVVRKLGAPGNPELGIGAVADDGVRVFDGGVLSSLLVELRRTRACRRPRRVRASAPGAALSG